MSESKSVWEIAREIHDTHTSANPHEMADELFRRLSPDQYRDVVREASILFVRRVVTQRRQQAIHGATAETVSSSRGPAPYPHSWRVAGIRKNASAISQYGRLLSMSIKVGPGVNAHKRFQDCTQDDLRFASQQRHDIAVQNANVAYFYERVGKQLEQHQATRVIDLPEDVLLKELPRYPKLSQA